jgi:hypothetical protein
MVKRAFFLLLICLILLPATSQSYEVYRKGDVSLDIGYWAQAWYQYVNDYDRDADGQWDDTINDFMIRRTYFSVQGTVTPKLDFFMHYAGDRIGQEGLDDSGMGLGTGLALRDGWVTYKILENDLMIQAGRMYVPFTRNYGTTSTKAMLTTELDWGQGGIRSGIFYPSKVGRDDGITVWGNIIDGKFQYRLMVGEGQESSAANPDDRLRFAGRVSFNPFDTETSWFNKETNLGQKKIVSIGAGFDSQSDLIIGAQEMDYSAFTADLFLDLPLAATTLTSAVSYIKIKNAVNAVTWSDLGSGKDGDIFTSKAGFLLKPNIQPFAHYQMVMPDGSSADDTTIFGFGCNYYIKGLANKLTAEWTQVDDEDHTVDIITIQAAFGF